AGGFARPIDVEDQIPLARPVPQATKRLSGPSPGRRRVQKERAQRLQTRAIYRREKATQGTSMWLLSPLKKRHKGDGKWLQPGKEHLQGPFATECIAKQQREKIEDLIPAKAGAHQAHLSTKSLEESMTAKMASEEDEFSKPRGN